MPAHTITPRISISTAQRLEAKFPGLHVFPFTHTSGDYVVVSDGNTVCAYDAATVSLWMDLNPEASYSADFCQDVEDVAQDGSVSLDEWPAFCAAIDNAHIPSLTGSTGL